MHFNIKGGQEQDMQKFREFLANRPTKRVNFENEHSKAHYRDLVGYKI